jgi:O-antigen/teichoic acid export membrane protein
VPKNGHRAEKSLGERAIILMVGRVGAVIVGLATPMVLVRVFSQEEFGAYREITLAIFTVLGIVSPGFAISLYYFYPKYPDRRKTFVSQGLYSHVIFGSIFLIFTFFAGHLLADLFKHEIFYTAGPLIGVIVLFQLVRSYLETLLIVEKRITWASLYIIVHNVLRGGVLVLVVLIIPSLKAIIISLLVYEGLLFILVIIYTAIRYDLFRFPVTKSAIIEQSRYALPFGLGGTLAVLSHRLDQLLIVYRYSPADFAIYSQGAFPMRFFNVPHQSISDIVVPKAVALLRDGQRLELIKLWYDLTFKMAIITIPVVVLSEIVGTDAMVLLFTEQYRISGHLYQFYVLVLLRYVPAYGVLPRAYGRTVLIMWSNVASLATLVVFGWIGITYFGMFGMVAAYIISQYVTGYIQLQRGRRDIGLPRGKLLPWKRIIQVTALAILAAILPFGAKVLIHSLPIRLVSCVLLYAIGYVALLYLTRVFDWLHDPTIRKVLNRYLPFVPVLKSM